MEAEDEDRDEEASVATRRHRDPSIFRSVGMRSICAILTSLTVLVTMSGCSVAEKVVANAQAFEDLMGAEPSEPILGQLDGEWDLLITYDCDDKWRQIAWARIYRTFGEDLCRDDDARMKAVIGDKRILEIGGPNDPNLVPLSWRQESKSSPSKLCAEAAGAKIQPVIESYVGIGKLVLSVWRDNSVVAVRGEGSYADYADGKLRHLIREKVDPQQEETLASSLIDTVESIGQQLRSVEAQRESKSIVYHVLIPDAWSKVAPKAEAESNKTTFSGERDAGAARETIRARNEIDILSILASRWFHVPLLHAAGPDVVYEDGKRVPYDKYRFDFYRLTCRIVREPASEPRYAAIVGYVVSAQGNTILGQFVATRRLQPR